EEAGDDHRFLPPEELVEWARYLAVQCPECQGEALWAPRASRSRRRRALRDVRHRVGPDQLELDGDGHFVSEQEPPIGESLVPPHPEIAPVENGGRAESLAIAAVRVHRPTAGGDLQHDGPGRAPQRE